MEISVIYDQYFTSTLSPKLCSITLLIHSTVQSPF
jgi:hypothetical protein